MLKVMESVHVVGTLDWGIERAADVALVLGGGVGIALKIAGKPLPAILILGLIASAMVYGYLAIRRYKPKLFGIKS